jgi:hypothetical protein
MYIYACKGELKALKLCNDAISGDHSNELPDVKRFP